MQAHDAGSAYVMKSLSSALPEETVSKCPQETQAQEAGAPTAEISEIDAQNAAALKSDTGYSPWELMLLGSTPVEPPPVYQAQLPRSTHIYRGGAVVQPQDPYHQYPHQQLRPPLPPQPYTPHPEPAPHTRNRHLPAVPHTFTRARSSPLGLGRGAALQEYASPYGSGPPPHYAYPPHPPPYNAPHGHGHGHAPPSYYAPHSPGMGAPPPPPNGYPQPPGGAPQQYTAPVGYPTRRPDVWAGAVYGKPDACALLSPEEMYARQGPNRRKSSPMREKLLAQHNANHNVSLSGPANPALTLMTPAQLSARKHESRLRRAQSVSEDRLKRFSTVSSVSSTEQAELTRAATSPLPGTGASTSADPKLSGGCDHFEHVLPNWVRGREGLSPANPGYLEHAIRSSFAPMRRRYRALIVGITYREHSEAHTLPGASTDLRSVYIMLMSQFGYNAKDIRVLTDEPGFLRVKPHGPPTLAQILDGMRWLWEGAQEGDTLFFFFAGHGNIVRDYNNDEQDSDFDQCLMPIDFHTAGFLIDDMIYEWLIRRVPFGARLTCLIDACTSGTVCDLPFLYTSPRGNRIRPYSNFPPQHKDPTQRVGESVLFAGSKDLQRALDLSNTGEDPFGIMTRAFCMSALSVLNDQRMGARAPMGTFDALVQQTIARVRHLTSQVGIQETQDPQFSASHLFDINQVPFSI